MTVWPLDTMVHRVLAPLSQEGMVCCFFLTTTGMTGGCVGQWEKQSPNSVAEPASLGCDRASTRIDRFTAFEIICSSVLCTDKKNQCFLSIAYAQGQCLLGMLILTLFQIQLYPPELDGSKHHIIETRECPSSPDADELKIEVQGSKVKLTEIFHKADSLLFLFIF